MVAAPSSGVAMDSMISSVRDMLPFLGEGFVEKCLAHYNYKVCNENISVTFVGYQMNKKIVKVNRLPGYLPFVSSR